MLRTSRLTSLARNLDALRAETSISCAHRWLLVLVGTSFGGGCSFSGPAATPDAGVEPTADAATASEWADVRFAKRRLVTVDNSGLGPLEGFPVFVPLESVEQPIGAGGQGVLFYVPLPGGGFEALPATIDSRAAGIAGAWVAVELVDDASTQLFLYYDFDAAENPPPLDVSGTPFSDFAALYHFSGSWAESAVDSASGFDLPALGMPKVAPGHFGNGVDLLAGDSFRSLSASAPPLVVAENSSLLIEAWVNINGGSVFDHGIVDGRDSGCGPVISINNAGFLIGEYRLGPNCNSSSGAVTLTSSDAVPADSWHHVAYSLRRAGAASSLELYVDGASVGTVQFDDANAAEDASNFHLGNNFVSGAPFEGTIDEVRLGPARTEAWLRASFEMRSPVSTGRISVSETLDERP